MAKVGKQVGMTMVSGLVAVAALLSGCSGSQVDIGDKNVKLSKSDLAAYAASWDGYAEAYLFEDRTDRVRLVLDAQGHGSVRFGERDLFDPPTDPAANYPPQWHGQEEPASKLWSGFAYTAQNARVESDRIRLGVVEREAFAGYCALQTPYLDPLSTAEEPRYQILPYVATSVESSDGTTCTIADIGSDGEWIFGDPTVDVPCEQAKMNDSDGCFCTETGCTSVPTAGPSYVDVSIDAALDDPQEILEGTMLIDNQRITVRLMRQ